MHNKQATCNTRTVVDRTRDKHIDD